MRVAVVEPHAYHTSFLRMYAELLPSLLGTGALEIRYLVRGKLIESIRALLGAEAAVESLALGPVDLGPGHAVGSWWVRQRAGAFVSSYKPDVLILNTLDGEIGQGLFRQLPARVKIGLLHNAHTEGPVWQPGAGESIACLHRYNYEALRDELPITAYFSPYFIPRYNRQRPPLGAPLRIAVPGVISFDRRDYELLVDVAERLAAAGLASRVVFDIVGESRGRDGPRLRRLVESRGFGRFFRFHTDLTDSEFFQRLCNADFICALVRPGEGPYARGKVTLAYGNSGALGRPLLVHRAVALRTQLPESVCATYESVDDVLDVIRTGREAAEDLVAPYQRYVRDELAANREHLSDVSRRLFAGLS